MDVAPDRPGGADRGHPRGGDDAAVRRTAGELPLHLHAQRRGARLVAREQREARRRGLERQEDRLVRDVRVGVGRGVAFDDLADAGPQRLAVRRGGVADVELALRVLRDDVDRHAALHRAHVGRDAGGGVREGVQVDHLAREGVDGARALFRVDARVRRDAVHLEIVEERALAARDDVARGAPRLGVEGGERPARQGKGDVARPGRGHLLVTGEKNAQRRGGWLQFREGPRHEGIHHQARLHVRHARAVALATFRAEGAARRRACGKDRVHVAQEQDMGRAGRPVRHLRGNAVAVPVDRVAPRGDSGVLHQALEERGHAVGAGLVGAAAVEVHRLLQQGQHLAAVAGKPVQHGLRLGARAHVAALSFCQRISMSSLSFVSSCTRIPLIIVP